MQINDLLQEGIRLQQAQQFNAAQEIYDQILTISPTHPDCWHLKGLIYCAEQLWQLAFDCINQAINLDNKQALFYNSLGHVQRLTNNFASAKIAFKKAISLNPNYKEAYLNLCLTYWQMGDYFKLGTLALKANHKIGKISEIIILYTESLKKLGQLDKALQILEKESCPQISYHLAITYFELERYQDALNKLQQIKPNANHANLNLQALCLEKLERFDEAFTIYQQLLQLNPQDSDALNNLANLYKNKGAIDLQLQCLEKAYAINPKHVNTLNNLGNYYVHQGEVNKGLNYYQEALALAPSYEPANYNLANLYLREGYPGKALQIYESLLTLPGRQNYFKYLLGRYLSWNKLCFFKEIEANSAILAQLDNFPLNPFYGLELGLNPELQIKITQTFQRQFKPIANITTKATTKAQLNIAYLSPDFNQHAVGLLINDHIKAHNKNKFNVHTISYSTSHDYITDSIIENSNYNNFAATPAQTIVEYIKDNSIDIIIDLAGYTSYNRIEVLKSKPAPLQMHWLGYPASLQLEAIDYYLTSSMQVPISMQPLFQEQLVYLPTLIATNGFNVTSAESLPEELLELKNNHFIYACLHHPYRITMDNIKAWSEILLKVPHSLLFLKAGEEIYQQKMYSYFKNYNIDANRIIFISNEPLTKRYLQKTAHVWLDAFKLSGGTSVNICNWTHTPVVTLAGTTPQSCTGAAINQAANMQELIAYSIDEYIDLAVKLATTSYYQHIITQMKNIASSDLFNVAKFTQQFEDKLVELYANSN